MPSTRYLSATYELLSLGTDPLRFFAILVFTFIAYSSAILGIVNAVQNVSVHSYGTVAILSLIALWYLIYRIRQRVLSCRLGGPLGTLASTVAHLGLSSVLLGFANIVMRGSINATVQFVVQNPFRAPTYVIIFSLFFVTVLYLQATFQSQSEHRQLQDSLHEWLDALEEVEQQDQLDKAREAADRQLIATSRDLIEELDDAGIQGGTELQADLRSWITEYKERSMPVREKIITGESHKEGRKRQHQKLTGIRRQINALKQE